MVQLVTAILFNLLWIAQANAESLTLKSFENNAYHEVAIVEVKGVRLSSECLKANVPKCKAWSVLNGKRVKKKKDGGGLAGNPAAIYCGNVNGQNRILKSADGKQYDFCRFDDGSMIDAWNLYSQHHGGR